MNSPSKLPIDAILWTWDACRLEDALSYRPGTDQAEVEAAALSLAGEQADMIHEAVRRDACVTDDDDEVRKATGMAGCIL